MSVVEFLTLERENSSEIKTKSTGRQMCLLHNNETRSDLDALHACHMSVPHWSLVTVVHYCVRTSYSTPSVQLLHSL